MLESGPGRSTWMTPESFAAVVDGRAADGDVHVFPGGVQLRPSGDLAARQSMYPARMFTLPVTTAALAGWPMLYGTAAMAILLAGHEASRRVAVGSRTCPMIWPALLAASLLAWTQALTWMPYGVARVCA